MIVGIPAVVAMYYTFFTSFHRQQRRKEMQDHESPMAIPTWEHRLKQATSPARDSENPATLRASIFEKKPESSDKRAGYSDSFVAKSMYPTEQQDNAGGEGHVDTKENKRTQKPPGEEGADYTKRQELTR
jgi:hypothetical protein